MGKDALLERLAQSPRLGLYVHRLTEMLADEHDRRERFYDAMTEGAKQEFINGEVILHSPVKLEHEKVSSLLYRLLSTHVDIRRLGRVGHEKLLICLSRNDYEPDVCYFDNAKASQFTSKQMKFPAPDFVAEVLSESTEAIDRGIKFDDYAAHGVGEYWIIDPAAEVVEQYVLSGDSYVLRLKMNSGVLRSEVVKGFEVPIRAIFDEQENLKAMRDSLASC
jgi:Uma2 family endonuclease